MHFSYGDLESKKASPSKKRKKFKKGITQDLDRHPSQENTNSLMKRDSLINYKLKDGKASYEFKKIGTYNEQDDTGISHNP